MGSPHLHGPAAAPAAASDRLWLLGLPFDRLTLQDTVSRIRAAAAARQRLVITTVNVNWVVACQSDEAMRCSVLNSDLSVADGTPLVWLSRLVGQPLPERVAGSDLFNALRRPSGGLPLRVYFFGGPPGAAAAACEALNAERGGCIGVGHQSPGFGSVESMSSPETIAAINAARPDFVVVSLGARKGQDWIERNRAELDAPVLSHLGAVVNFVAGSLRQAPPWVGTWGLEWLWRLSQEPALWRRYLWDGLKLAALILRRGVRFGDEPVSAVQARPQPGASPRRSVKKRSLTVAVVSAALIAIASVALVTAGTSTRPDPTRASPEAIARLHNACVEEMIRSTCKVMSGPSSATVASSVFIAGIGPVDAAYYRELRASGDAMCAVVRRACEADWNGPQCRTARGLYGSVGAAR